MNWFILAFFCAFFTSVSDALSKVAMRRADEYVVGWAKLILAAPVFLLAILYSIQIPRLDFVFWRTVACLLPIELFAYIIYLKAIKRSPLSLTVPFLAFTPVFAIATSFIVLKERVGISGVSGILCVTVGSYLLNVDIVHRGILEPVKAIFREQGSRYMLLVAFIFSFTAVLGKLALRHSSVLFFPAFYFVLLGFAMTIIVVLRMATGRSKLHTSKRQLMIYVILSWVFILIAYTHYQAVSKANVAYMISIKRLSLLFGVIYGGLLFKEERMIARFGAALLMFVGAALIVTAK